MKKEERSSAYQKALEAKNRADLGGHMANTLTLRQTRAALTDAMKSLVDTAEGEKRNLSSDENSEFKQMETLAERMGSQIEEIETRQREGAERARRAAGGAGMDSEWRDVKTGAPVAVLTRDQRMADQHQSEFKNLSLGKALRSMVTGNWSDAQEEHRALSTSISSAGVVVPTVLASGILDLARAKSVVMQAGARTVDMPYGNMTIAKVTQDPPLEYKAENAAFAEQEVGFGPVNLKAHTLGTIVTISRELAMDSPNAAQAITTALAGALAAEIDRVALIGTGTTQPLGILNATGIQELTGLANFTNYADFISAWVKMQEANGAANGYIVCPRDAGALESLMTTGGEYMVPPRSIDALSRYVSNNIPKNLGVGTNESVAFFGDFTTMLFGVTQGMLIEATTDGGGAFEKHQVKFKVTWRGDVGFERPNWLVRLRGITA